MKGILILILLIILFITSLVWMTVINFPFAFEKEDGLDRWIRGTMTEKDIEELKEEGTLKWMSRHYND